MATLTRSVTVDAPLHEVFDYALDITKLWQVKDVALANVDLKPAGTGTSARMYTHILALHIEGGLEYTEVVPDKRIVVQVRFLVENPTWTFTFKPVGGRTKVTAVGEWTTPIPVVGARIDAMMAREHATMLEELLATMRGQVEAKLAA